MRHHPVPATQRVLHRPPDVVLRRGLHVPHVARVAVDLARLERLRDGVLVADRAARGVHDPRAGLKVLEKVAVDEALRAGVQRGVDGEDVELGDELLQVFDAACAQVLVRF